MVPRFIFERRKYEKGTILTRRVPLVEQELVTLPEHPSF
jgi:hypothetical protein